MEIESTTFARATENGVGMTDTSRIKTDERAQLAYKSYAQALGIDKGSGARTWETLPEQRKNAWRAVAASLTDDE